MGDGDEICAGFVGPPKKSSIDTGAEGGAAAVAVVVEET